MRDVAVTAGTLARDLDQVYADGPRDDRARRPLDVVVGFYEKWRDNLYNSAAYVRLGDGAARIIHVHRKNFLPTYGLFDEERFVERGPRNARHTDVGSRGHSICPKTRHSIKGTWQRSITPNDLRERGRTARGLRRGGRPVRQALSAGRPGEGHRGQHGVFVSLANMAGAKAEGFRLRIGLAGRAVKSA